MAAVPVTASPLRNSRLLQATDPWNFIRSSFPGSNRKAERPEESLPQNRGLLFLKVPPRHILAMVGEVTTEGVVYKLNNNIYHLNSGLREN
jgi:hypothetical protein